MTTIAEEIAQERIRELEQGLRETSEALKTYEALTVDLRERLKDTQRMLDAATSAARSLAVGMTD